MPKFLRQVRDRRKRGERVSAAEFLLRINYMSSIAWASLGLIFLLAYPYDSRLLSLVVLLAAIPYFVSMGVDLRSTGYKFSDIFRIYGFNLILLAVNVAGVLKSLEQAITMKKIGFVRTPKVKNRTAAPWLYVLMPYVIVAFSVFIFWQNYFVGNWGNATFAALNATLASYAIIAYIGVRNSIVDIWLGLTAWLWVPINPADKPTPLDAATDWRAVLYHGDADPTKNSEHRSLKEREFASTEVS
jgi:cellulose synthase (UDP-forming)